MTLLAERDAPARPAVVLACPACHARLEVDGECADCAACGRVFTRTAGVWRFLSAGQRCAFATFLREYATVRAAERWVPAGAADYAALPDAPPGDPHAGVWRQRRRSFAILRDRVVRPLAAQRGRPLTILDLGAGSAWLASRLADMGHAVAALDVSVDDADGLGARARCTPLSAADSVLLLEAAFDRLPIADAQADLVVFNASLHYARDCAVPLGEALRVLRPDGRVVVMDSPVYRDPRSGAAMVREREEALERAFGFRSDALGSEGYFTVRRLEEMASALAIRWRWLAPTPIWRSLAARLRAWLRGRREPATLFVLVGRPATARELRAPRGRVVAALVRRFLRARFRLLQRRRHNRLVVERVGADRLIVLPGVFNPRLFATGEFLVAALDRHSVTPGAAVLDLGTGSGVAALAAAALGARVVAVDLSPPAVRCARLNALLRGVEDRVDVRAGDLFEPLRGERFDLVLFNPPYFRGAPRDALDMAWHAVDVIERFAAGVAAHLAPGASALVVLSTAGELAAALRAFRAADLAASVVRTRALPGETLVLFRLYPGRELLG